MFKKAHLIQIRPDEMVKGLQKSINIDYEMDKHEELHSVVITIVQNHMGAASLMEVERILSWAWMQIQIFVRAKTEVT